MKSFSDIFIYRPIATILLTLSVIFAGILGFNLLPVSPLPELDIPTISVSASLAGADAETMASTVATPLERALGSISGITEMTSSSSQGFTRVVMQFDLARDINGAARDVQAAINASRSLLPTSLRNNPNYRKVNPADAPIIVLGLTSTNHTQGQMYDTASTLVAQRLLQIKGVGDVNVGGSSLPAVRVELNPDALSNKGISLTAVGNAITDANRIRPKGALEEGDKHWQVDANDQLNQAADYKPLIISQRNGTVVRLSDVANVIDSVENVRNAGRAGGKPSILLIVTRAPGENIIETVDRIKAELPEINSMIPASMDLSVMMDRSVTIRASLKEVEFSLVLSVILVILVVYLFLGRVRATLIPAVVVPVSLIGTFGIMYLCGFSLNNLSLMALAIATGFVVDDAIVVLENASRHIEKGVAPFEAALRSAKEVGFTVLSMSLSLVAVFSPFLFMGDMVGRLFREFAATLTAAILISLVVSLTTTPMMCAYLLSRKENTVPKPPNFIIRGFNHCLHILQHAYASSLAVALKHTRLVMLSLVGALLLNVVMFVVIPKGFMPEQDTGAITANIRADQSVSFQNMQGKFEQFMQIVLDDPAVETVMGSTGGGNSANLFITLKPLAIRNESVQRVISRLRKESIKVAGAQMFLNPVQDFRVGGRSSNSTYQYTLQSDDLKELREWTPRLVKAMTNSTVFTDVDSDQEDGGLEMGLIYDRDAMAQYGITVANANGTLYTAFGQRTISTIYAERNQYKVVIEVAPEYTQTPDTLNQLVLINNAGEAVPLSAFAQWAPKTAPLRVNHQGQFAASTVSFNLAEGKALSDASSALELLMVQIGMPNTVHGSFQGTAKTFQQNQSSQLFVLLTAIVGVYLILGMLYESYIHPITILSTLPSASLGALIALWTVNKEFTLMALIAILLLIGIVKKNAIMMIDFALELQRNQGLPPKEAIYQACLLRFRPILMTTLAAILGAVPLALGTGDGAEMRQPLGIAIVGGLVMSQILTLYTTPVIYLYLDRFGHWIKYLLRCLFSRSVNPQRAKVNK